MQNLLASWQSIWEDGIYQVPYKGETRIGMVDLEEVAEAAAVVLSEPSHKGAIYELAGPEVLSQEQIVHILSRQMGRQIRLRIISRENWSSQARDNGLGKYQVFVKSV